MSDNDLICPSCGQLHENWSGEVRGRTFLDMDDGSWRQVTGYLLKCPETAVEVLGSRVTTGHPGVGLVETGYSLQLLDEEDEEGEQ